MKKANDSARVFRRTGIRPSILAFRNDEGFSLIEIGIFLFIACAVAAFALLNLHAIMPGMHANEAMFQTIAQLRHGRELAITQRRSVQLDFPDGNQIRLVQNGLPDGESLLSAVPLLNSCRFIQFPEVDQDTPDRFGNSSSVDFGDAREYTFLTDG